MISYYELLGMIKTKNNPERVIYNNTIFEFDGMSYIFNNKSLLDTLMDRGYTEYGILDIQIEIIEEIEKPKEIEPLDFKYNNTYGNVSQHKASERDIINKINELSKAVNYLLKKEEDKQ